MSNLSNSDKQHYFSHDSNAHRDEKMLSLRAEYGWKGYGIFWAIVELMREQSNYKLEYSDSLPDKLALQFNLEPKFAKEFIESCLKYGLFEKDNGNIYAESLLRRMAIKESKSKQARKAAEKRWDSESSADEKQKESESNADAMRTQCDSNANKVKESKVKEIKTLYNYWREKSETITHRKLSSKMKSAITARLKDYSVDELKEAIDNYNMVVKSDDYFFSYDNWSLNEFLSRGEGEQVEKFLENPDAYLKDNKKNSDKSTPAKYKPDYGDLRARGLTDEEANRKIEEWERIHENK